MSRLVDPLDVGCPCCGARPGEYCIHGSSASTWMHQARHANLRHHVQLRDSVDRRNQALRAAEQQRRSQA